MLKRAKAIVDNRNNGEDGRIAFRILKCIIFIVVAVVVIIFCMARLSTNHAVGTYINNNQVSGYDKEKTALNQTAFLEFSDTCVVAFDSNDLHGISVTLDGQTSEKHLYASTEASQVAQSLGIAEITIGDDGSFTFDANYSFEVGETVLMTVEYNGSDNDFGSDITTKYFAFVVGESTNSSSSSTGTIDANTEENSDMTPSVYFNGVTVATFDSKENAISNCERSYVSSYDIMVEPNGVDRVIISTYTLNLDDGSFHFNNAETFIYSGTDWSAHIDLSQYVGEVIVVKVRVEGADILENRYFAVQLRESEATEEETIEAD